MKRRYLCGFILTACFCLIPTGCSRPPEKRYDLKGKVVAMDKGQRLATIAHEAIPGFMEAMTMPFSVKEDWAVAALEPGQEIEATLVVSGEKSWIEALRISQTKDMAGVSVSGPKIGAEVPDFTLLNQDGKPIRLTQYRGRPLLLTFIYTRCPLPDYCPRTSKNFSEIYRGIQSLPASRRPQLLTVSFDSEYDTPEVLQKYGRRYMNPPAFDLWTFATGSPDEIKKITGYFGLSYWKDSGQIVHSLVTAWIGPDGKIARLYLGKEWTFGQILTELR